MTTDRTVVAVPTSYPASLIFMDESGSKSSGSRFFVMSALKLRHPGTLLRELQTVRDRNQFSGEFKFSEITKGTMCAYLDAIDALGSADAHVAACVVNRSVADPFDRKQPDWENHALVASKLLAGCINRRELVSVIMDGISTPSGIAIDEKVRSRVNRGFGTMAVVTAVCADSRTNDGLQLADLVAGAIAFDRRQADGLDGRSRPSTTSPKAKVAARLMSAFGRRDFADYRDRRVNIATFGAARAPRGGAAKLAVVRP